jgi:hypothetical protein
MRLPITTIRLEPALKQAVEDKAAELNLPYQTLLKVLVKEGLKRIEQDGVPVDLVTVGAHRPVIYFLQDTTGDRLVKIGITRNFKNRLPNLQNAFGCTLTPLYAFFSKWYYPTKSLFRAIDTRLLILRPCPHSHLHGRTPSRA